MSTGVRGICVCVKGAEKAKKQRKVERIPIPIPIGEGGGKAPGKKMYTRLLKICV